MASGHAWRTFCHNWNQTLQRRPQNVIGTFLASQTATVVALFGAFSTLGVRFPAEIAVGYMASKLTKKFRQPLNIALAAGLARFVPSLSLLKVTPLLTGAVSDKKAVKQMEEFRSKLESHPSLSTSQREMIKSGISRMGQFGSWLQGPVDQYGFALYISGRLTSIATVSSVTLLTMQGLDVPDLLSSIGLNGDFQSEMGGLMGSAVVNTFLFPMHFGVAVYGTQMQEALAHQYVGQQPKSNSEGNESEDGEEDPADETISNMATALLFLSLGVQLYLMKLLGTSALKKQPENTKEVPIEK